MPRFPSCVAVLAVLAIATPGVAAFAQTSPQTGPAAPAAEPVLPKAVSAKVEQHIKELHQQLGITPAEQPQWDQFAQVMRDNAAEINQAFTDRGNKLAAMNATENMQSYARLAQVHATNMQKLASAFQSLYSGLPDPQKQVADTVFRKSNGMPKRQGK